MQNSHDLSRPRLARLTEALSLIMGISGATEHTTIGELGLDSAHLVDVMIACEEIYAATIDFASIDIDYDMSIATLHTQLDRQVPKPVASAGVSSSA
jgi:acyl carrier protein